MKDFGDARILAGECCLVVDLEACTGMDSTFMGTLAGMASRLAVNPGGVLHIAEAGMRNRRSLEDLGLDFLMEIDPPGASWCDDLETLRARLKPPQSLAPQDKLQRTTHVLEAHQLLADTNEKNAQVFSSVIAVLENELAENREPANPPRES